jgi:hypothetical protein
MGGCLSHETELLSAAKRGDAGAVRAVLRRRPSLTRIDCRDPTHGTTPLSLAACHGHAEVLTLLMARRADVNAASTVRARRKRKEPVS